MQPKRILISLLAVILICLAAGLTVSAAETSPLNLAVSVTSDAAISTSPVTVQAGDTLEVSVTVAENPGVAILEFTLEYDPAVLSVKTDGEDVVYANGDVFSDDAVLLVFEKTPGVLVVRYISSANATATNATLLTVEFTVVAGAVEEKGATAVSLVVDPDYVANAEYDYVEVALAEEGKFAFAAHGELTLKQAAKAACEASIYECSDCGEEITIPATADHQPVTTEGTPAKCGVAGVTDTVACSACGLVITASEEIPALEHEIASHEGKAATCLEDGWKAYETCTREGCEYTTYEAIEAAGSHTLVTDPAVEPTYSTEGKTEGSHCSVCGEVIVEQQTIPAKSLLWLWILIAVVVVVAAGVVVYFFVYKKNVQTKHIGRPGSQK